MPQKNLTGNSGASFEPVALWVHYGRSTLSMLKGYSILFLEGEFGILNSRQQEVMQKISQLADETMNSWNEFAAFFKLNSPDGKIISPAEIDPKEFHLLHEKIIHPALTSLQQIRGDSDDLLQEKHGTITDKQQEWLDELHKMCAFAIRAWQEPVNYFKR